eukprot:1508258-Alexandrium_andersonii.AAC.1
MNGTPDCRPGPAEMTARAQAAGRPGEEQRSRQGPPGHSYKRRAWAAPTSLGISARAATNR